MYLKFRYGIKHFVLLTLVFASLQTSADEGFEITIVAGTDKKSSSVVAKGEVSTVITDDYRNVFKIGDDHALKDAVNAYFGKKPNDAYLKSKTPWGDLYTKYNWDQVEVVTKVDSAKIVEITANPSILSSKTLQNSSNVTGTFDASISETVSNTTESNWSEEDSITVGQSFSYDVSFLGSGGGGETSLEYSHTWGQGGSESQSIDVGSQQGVTVSLDPGQEVLAELNASRGTMKIEIVYKTYLKGIVAVNYNPKYKHHHFWALGIHGVMQSGGLSSEILSTETIELGYYSNGQVILKNVK